MFLCATKSNQKKIIQEKYDKFYPKQEPLSDLLSYFNIQLVPVLAWSNITIRISSTQKRKCVRGG